MNQEEKRAQDLEELAEEFVNKFDEKHGIVKGDEQELIDALLAELRSR